MITKVGHIIGHILIYLGISELVPIFVALYYGEGTMILPFFICSMLTIFIGLGFYFAFNDEPEKPSRYDIISFLVFAWLIIPVFASMPFMVSGELTKFTDAYFEATSAFTTSGATLLSNSALSPKTILFWRSLLQWEGGIFLFVLAVAIVPLSAIGGSELFRSALPHGEKEGFVSRINTAFKPLATIYIGLTLLCLILLNLTNMTFFDAMSTSMATLSSGGFTNHANFGVNSFGNVAEFILIPFMVIAASNLTYHWSFMTTGKLRAYRNDREIKYFAMIIIFAAIIIFLSLTGEDGTSHMSFLKKIGVSIFTAVSALSTTGYLPDGANTMPLAVGIVCITLLFVGGAMGSSAGGFKIMRIKVLFRQADSEISRLAHPHGIVPMRVNDISVTSSILMSIWTLLFLYLSTIALFSVLYGLFGYNMETGIGLAVVNLFSAGSMTGLIAPDFMGYSGMTYTAKWVTSVLMILGRLEIIALLIFISPSFRKN
ncbi:MAG: TrkH family potassium uptake protein [Kordiimonadaceae bacterium]|jgi:trk system potassium uptake protein|nr:TrkH family potassium uptake protein [Kordiimonadaceae bacterium]MBT6035247.1 TrkH family potassium uptake protein [Kordiimonadaceae bacterium]MBT6330084.1 TrkH family potassium uptake protein [Kordiimonadaceae bacterium]MBT7583677.1 TrkH family potassium uptake protein [Kordiimonadaceae bacterium]